MKLPRDIDGKELVKALEKLGYSRLRQKGSHVYLVSSDEKHHIAVPLHSPLKLGTFSGILSDVAGYREMDKEQLLRQLFGWL